MCDLHYELIWDSEHVIHAYTRANFPYNELPWITNVEMERIKFGHGVLPPILLFLAAFSSAKHDRMSCRVLSICFYNDIYCHQEVNLLSGEFAGEKTSAVGVVCNGNVACWDQTVFAAVDLRTQQARVSGAPGHKTRAYRGPRFSTIVKILLRGSWL